MCQKKDYVQDSNCAFLKMSSENKSSIVDVSKQLTQQYWHHFVHKLNKQTNKTHKHKQKHKQTSKNRKHAAT